ncbi:MAG: ATP-binding protein [Bacteroidota bacterium]
MKILSFRIIILFTLILVTSIISFSAFKIYSYYLEKKINAESERMTASALVGLDLLKDQIYYTIGQHDGRIIDTLLRKMSIKDQVLNSYLFNGEGELKYSHISDTANNINVAWEELSALDEGIILKSFSSVEKPFSRAYFHMHNSPACYECHTPEQENLGYVVIDFPLNETESTIVFIRKWSLLLTLVMVIVILSTIIFMHYKFVRKSLREFHKTILSVNQGNLEQRISIPETKELGQLGKNFNNMLDTFQRAQKELQEFHKKELRTNYKLATIGEMAARLAHEIRNPITGIASAIEIIVAESNDQQNIPILEEVQRQAKRVNDAISDLLKYSRKKELNLIMNNINEVINQLVFFLKSQVQNRAIEIHLNLQDDIPHFRFDPKQMEDVLLNMGLNAIQAIPKSGAITFTTAYNSSEKRIYIHVSDTGKGIPEEDLSRIFHPFFTTRNEGTGLGLAIVKDVIDTHHGEIWAENNRERGCTFTISLPETL